MSKIKHRIPPSQVMDWKCTFVRIGSYIAIKTHRLFLSMIFLLIAGCLPPKGHSFPTMFSPLSSSVSDGWVISIQPHYGTLHEHQGRALTAAVSLVTRNDLQTSCQSPTEPYFETLFMIFFILGIECKMLGLISGYLNKMVWKVWFVCVKCISIQLLMVKFIFVL